MRIIDRYILKGYVQSLVYCLTAFISLYIIVDLFNYMDEMMRNRLPVKLIFTYYATLVPLIFVQVAPMAALLSSVYTISNLKRYNELTAMRVSGVSLWKVLKPLLFTTAILCILVFAVNDRIVPETTQISTQIKDKDIKNMADKKKTVIKNIAVFGSGNRIIYARSFDIKKKELRDIIVHQNDENHNLVMRISAQRAFWKNGKWVFENGTSYRLDKAGYIIGTPSTFRRRVTDITEKPRYFAQKGRMPEFMNYKQLKIYIEKFAMKGSATTLKLLVDLHHKTSLPFISLAVILVAAPFAFMMQRGGVLLGMGISMLVGVAFFAIHGISLALGKSGLLPPFLSAWLANTLFVFAGFYFMKKCT